VKEELNSIFNAIKDQEDLFGEFLFEKPSTEKIDYKEIGLEVKKIKPVNETNPVISQPTEKEGKEFKVTDLASFNKLINKCVKCRLSTSRNKFVFGVGNPNATVMLIGEGPGADEDIQGEPFVGRAGKLLNDILKAINFEREEVYIANIVKCRPPGNRNPLPDEIEMCFPYLEKQIELIKPRLILCLGLIAASSVLKTKLALGKLRGNVYEYKNIQTMVTYHPAALLRNPQWKRGCWEDVQKFRKLYDELAK
jgi:DNA polymerase